MILILRREFHENVHLMMINLEKQNRVQLNKHGHKQVGNKFQEEFVIIRYSYVQHIFLLVSTALCTWIVR